MNQTTEANLAKVPATAKHVGEVRTRWAWVEPSVWTDRMLTALEQGVKGGIWFSLIDKVYAPANLFASYAKVAANGGAAGVDHVTVEDFTKRLTRNLEKLAAQLKDDEYRPQNVRRVNIPKPGTKETRPLGIPTVRDRVVQGALRHVLEPIFERQFAEHSYGFRPGRGCKDALRRVDKLLKQGYRYVVDVDLKSYFDTIPLLSNLYLNELDHQMAHSGYEMTRYADDLVIQCRSREEAERALASVQAWTLQAGLTLHPTKTKIVDAEIDGFDFLGYRFVKHPQLSHDLPQPRRLGSHAIAEHPPQTTGRQRERAGYGPSTLAECLLCRAGAVQLDNGPCLGQSILSEVKLSTGEPDAGNPLVRFGGRGGRTQSAFPTPINTVIARESCRARRQLPH